MNLQELKRLALAAPQGPWKQYEEFVVSICETHETRIADAKYIAAANPDTVLQLITRIETLTPQVRVLQEQNAKLQAFVEAYDAHRKLNLKDGVTWERMDREGEMVQARKALDGETE